MCECVVCGVGVSPFGGACVLVTIKICKGP